MLGSQHHGPGNFDLSVRPKNKPERWRSEMEMCVGPARTDSNGLSRQRFVAATEQLDNGTAVVSVMGEVDLSTAPALEQTLLRVADDLTDGVIVDLTGCTFLDSQGLRTLIATKRRLERSSGRLALVVSNPSVLKIFQITQFDEPFEIHASPGAAGNGHG